jgi:hypothetical protein
MLHYTLKNWLSTLCDKIGQPVKILSKFISIELAYQLVKLLLRPIMGVLFWCSVFLENLACATPSQHFLATPAPDADAVAIQDFWKKSLLILNKRSDPTQAILNPWTQDAKVDLLKLYKSELAEIERRWQESLGLAKHPEKSFGSKNLKSIDQKKYFLEMNMFFHDKVTVLNQKSLAVLKESSQQQQYIGLDFTAKATKALHSAQSNSVTSLQAVQKYDSSGQIGFCFGRALDVQLRLSKLGIESLNMSKIFVVGQLKYQGHFWNFHMATMIRDSKNGFVVVDPLQEQVMPYREWVSKVLAYEIKGKLSRARIYVTEPRKFMPSDEQHTLEQLENPNLVDYFKDLARELMKEEAKK